MFDPKTNKFPYTLNTDEHYLKVKKNMGIVFDENYPYVDKSKKYYRKLFWYRVLMYTIVFPVTRIRLGLRIKGKKNLKQNKELINKGLVSVCNHVHMWDYLGILCAIKPYKPRFLTWDKNVNGENGKMMRSIGSIPIPKDSFRGKMEFLKEVESYIKDNGWLHVYSEGSMWEYYAPIRPFKKGASYFAYKCDKPVLPFAYTYRKPNWIRRKIFKQIACLTINIGEPIFINKDLPREEAINDLTIRTHDAICTLAGIDPKENIYEPLFNNQTRIDYYTDTYGVGYKGSH